MLTTIGALFLALIVSGAIVGATSWMVLELEKMIDGPTLITGWIFEAVIACAVVLLMQRYLIPMVEHDRGQICYAIVSGLIFAAMAGYAIKKSYKDDDAVLLIYGLPGLCALASAPLTLIIATR